MAARTDDSLLFVVEWFDPLPQLKKQYTLKYFPDQHMAEMVDVKSKKVFLKKSPCPESLTKEEFYVGGRILLYSRELDIVDYGDGKTRDRLSQQVQQTVVLFPPSSYTHWGKILDELLAQDCSLVQAQTVFVSPALADKAMTVLDENPRQSAVFRDGVSLTALFRGENIFSKVDKVVSRFLQQEGVQSFASRNGLQSSSLSALLFDPSLGTTATLDSCTCCLIKPHAMKARLAGRILDEVIAQGYEVSALKTLHFDHIQAEEFLEVYKGVVPEYKDHVMQLCAGLLIALELRAQDAVETFRVTAGPWDVEMARELRPDTLRGKFGVDRIRNVVHCTDLAEDAELECEYVFKLV
jgi:nucleoside-diphosphate kinase